MIDFSHGFTASGLDGLRASRAVSRSVLWLEEVGKEDLPMQAPKDTSQVSALKNDLESAYAEMTSLCRATRKKANTQRMLHMDAARDAEDATHGRP
ncbi:hypothetical protein ZWY2020_037246 [Hordeum vulgare]|nr:hypothetical protein ZWY2020_037246 [Hordeum vulgare]